MPLVGFYLQTAVGGIVLQFPFYAGIMAIMAASGTADDASYIEALATSIPVNWHIMLWNSKIEVRDRKSVV